MTWRRWSRPSTRRRRRKPDLFRRLHHQGLGPAFGRPQGQPRRADESGADGGISRRQARDCADGKNGPGRRSRRRRNELADFLEALPVAAGLPAPANVCRRSDAGAELARGGAMSTQEGFGQDHDESAELRRLRRRIVTTSPDVTVSTNLGGWVNQAACSRARAYERHLRDRENAFDLVMGFRAKRTPYRAGHRRDTICSCCCGAGPVAVNCSASGCCRSGRCTILHRPRPGCAQLRLLPGCAVSVGGDAVGHHVVG